MIPKAIKLGLIAKTKIQVKHCVSVYIFNALTLTLNIVFVVGPKYLTNMKK